MPTFIGDSPLKLFQAAAESSIEMSSAKFARFKDRVSIRNSSGSSINHADLVEDLQIEPMSATDFGEIGVSYNTFAEPPCLTVEIMGRSKNFAIHASDETRLETGEMMEPYFKKYLPKFIKYIGLQTVDFNFICKPFGPNI